MRVHISLPATDLARSQMFYSEMLAAPATKVRPNYLNFRLNEPAIHLSLFKGESSCNDSAQHFGIELPDAETFKAWQERLSDAGVDALSEPDARCCYARGDKIWLQDPDGHRWEIWHRTGEYDALIEPQSTCCTQGQ